MLKKCISLLYNKKLQKVQNNAARLILKISRNDHISPHLMALHWLPMEYRIKYNLPCMCFSSVSGTAPSYLSTLLSLHTPSRTLCSSSDGKKFCIPPVFTKSFGQRSFCHSAPSLWNSLPLKLRSSESMASFKPALKAHFFTEAFS